MNPMRLPEQAVVAFGEYFNGRPRFIAQAPGRVNLIGEHTDYNDGFVMPMAIDRAVWITLRPRQDGRVVVISMEQEGHANFDLSGITHDPGHWSEYVRGMAVMLQAAGYGLTGWEGVLSSDIPIGSGLSSSAALEMAIGQAFAAVSGFPFDGPEMARLGQQAENEWVGANTGIMDQMISANGQEGCASLIDCRDLTIEVIPLPADLTVLILDTMTRHAHLDSGYNERRASCERAADFLGVSHLRDLSIEEFGRRAKGLDDETMRRARHVISENERVLLAAQAMRAGDAPALGALMNASHASLRDDFEVTNEALDVMATIARGQTGCYGARMTGGGFGGCCVAIVETGKVDQIMNTIMIAYETATSIKPALYVSEAAGGASVEILPA